MRSAQYSPLDGNMPKKPVFVTYWQLNHDQCWENTERAYS